VCESVRVYVRVCESVCVYIFNKRKNFVSNWGQKLGGGGELCNVLCGSVCGDG
jgi:hypothetical protein